jgi:hypothetical protein
MKILVRDTGQTVQRVRVGVIGLAAVLLIIGLSATVFSVVNRERPVTVAGAPKADVAANLSISNSTTPSEAATGEPLAELGVAPSSGPSPTPTPSPARQ